MPRESTVRARSGSEGGRRGDGFEGPFVGRRALIAEVHDRLRGAGGFVTLVGPAGVGKTRLARTLASGVRELGAGSPLLCDLRDARSAGDVVSRLSSAAHVDTRHRPAVAEALEAIGDRLSSQQRLLVLDDADRLSPEAVRAVGRWLASEPAPRALVTARRRLDVEGESVIEVPVLDPEAARELFAARARPGCLDETPSEEVDRLLARLDGLPLAIELAAARTRLLTPGELLARLDARFALLRDGEGSSLEEALRLSWELLGEDGRSLLTQLAVFGGGISLPAAEQIVELDGKPALIDLLGELVDRHLLRRGTVDAPVADRSSETRFELYESVRDFALAHGDDAVRSAARERHRRFFVEAAERWASGLRGGRAVERRARLERDRANVASAIGASRDAHPEDAVRATLALERASSSHASARAALPSLDEAVAQAARVGPALEARARAARGWARQSLGEGEGATEDLSRACALAEACGDEEVRVDCLVRLGHHHLRYGRLEEARESLEAAAAIRADHALEAQAGEVADRLGILALEEGDVDEAILRFDEAARAHERGGDTLGLAAALSNGAVACLGQGRLTEARADVTRVIELAERLDEPRYLAVALINLGLVEQEEGRLGAAEEAYARGLVLLREVGYRRAEGTALRRIGLLAMERGDPERAREALEAALGVFREHRYARDECRCLGLLALLAHLGGDVARAERDLAAAERVAAASGPESALGPVRRALGAPVPAAIEAGPARAALGGGSFPEIRLLRRLAEDRAEAAAPVLRVERDGTWFALPDQPPVSLARRGPMRRVLVALAERRREGRHRGVDVQGLLEAGWPGERILPDAGAARVYEAVRMLRRLGLGEALLKRDEGYLLDPALAVEIVDVAPAG